MKYHNKMSSTRTYRSLAAILATVFLVFQVFTVAHAANFGENSHDHDGIACVVGVMSYDEQGVLPVEPAFEPIITYSFSVFQTSYQSIAYLTPPGRAPPPRSPPLTQ